MQAGSEPTIQRPYLMHIFVTTELHTPNLPYIMAEQTVLVLAFYYSDSLRAEGSGDRYTVGARFFEPVQTGPGAHPTFYTMGTGSFARVKRPGRGLDHPPPI